MRAIKTELAPPALEIGTGSGHFAEALRIDFGIDSAGIIICLARDRGVKVCRAIGEQLPFPDRTFGTIYLLFTECFLVQPAAIFRECRRVLKGSGHLVTGMVPAPSPWGVSLAGKRAGHHPLYRHAVLRSKEEIEAMLAKAGFTLMETLSTLRRPPPDLRRPEQPFAGYDEKAGFVILVARAS